MQAIQTPSLRAPSVGYWISLFLAPCLFLALMAVVDRAPPIDPALLRDQFRIVISDSQQPPQFREDLPAEDYAGYMDYTPVAADNVTSVWYQVEVETAEAPQGLWAVYLPVSGGTHAVFVNGALIGQTAPMRPPYAYFRTPLYFEFPSALLRPGVNKVEVHLVSVRYGGIMFPFYVGPAQSIEPTYAYANFLQVTLVHAAVVAMLLISLLTLGLFWVRPVETGYPWFAAATLCWAAYNAVLLEPRILIPPAGLWTALPPIALGWFSICSAFFINRLPGCGGPQPRTERGLLAFGVIGTLVVIAHRVSMHEESWIQAYVWLPGVVLINGYIAWRLLVAVRTKPTF
jgi:hypothetical protein